MLVRDNNGRLKSNINWDSYNPNAYGYLVADLNNATSFEVENRIFDDDYTEDANWMRNFNPFFYMHGINYDINTNDIRDFFTFDYGYDMMLLGFDITNDGYYRYYFTDVVRFENLIKEYINTLGYSYENLPTNQFDISEVRITVYTD